MQYASKGKAVVVPGLGVRTEVVLPQNLMRWATSQPDARLSVGEAFAEMDQARWSLGSDKVIVDAWQGMLVKTEMSRVLENICGAMNNELSHVFDEHFGVDGNGWRTIDLLPTVNMIVAQAASRFIVGLPLCKSSRRFRPESNHV